jgi:hypothetical protein
MWWCPHNKKQSKSTINQVASTRHTHYDKDEGVVSKTSTAAVNNLKIIKADKKEKGFDN